MILARIYGQLKLSTWLIRVRFVVTKDTITRLLTVQEFRQSSHPPDMNIAITLVSDSTDIWTTHIFVTNILHVLQKCDSLKKAITYIF